MNILSLLGFICIAFLGFKYAFSSGSYFLVTSPIQSTLKLKVTARQRFVLLLLAVGIIQAGVLSSSLLFVWILLLGVFLIKFGANISRSKLFVFYTAYLIWLLISLFRTPEFGFGFRMLAKYLYPLLVLLVTAKMTINDSFFYKALKVCFASALVANIILLLPSLFPIYSFTNLVFGPLLWWGPAIIDYNPFVLVLAIVLYQKQPKKIYILAGIIVFAIPLLSSVRTGLVGLVMVLFAISFFKYKLKSLPILGVIFVAFIGSILFVPSIREKMFRGAFENSSEVINRSADLTLDDIDTNGRNDLWEWCLTSFYKNNEITGSGIGQVQAMLYAKKSPFPELNALHNDYILLLCDNGQLGLVLYLLIIISFIVQAFQFYNNSNYTEAARTAAFIAGTSFCGIMACAFTDNVINYSLITLTYPYAFLGFAMALTKK